MGGGGGEGEVRWGGAKIWTTFALLFIWAGGLRWRLMFKVLWRIMSKKIAR